MTVILEGADMRPADQRLPHPKICNVCQHDVVILTRSNRHRRPMIWECDRCKASVGCHPGTYNPLGLLAASEIRIKRIQAHAAFDPIWETKLMERHQAYEWLANHLQIGVNVCHISQFDEWQLEKVIAISNKFLKIENVVKFKRDKKRNARLVK